MKGRRAVAGQSYVIRVKGQIGSEWADWLERGLKIRFENGESVLTGVLEDQAALHGVLAKIRDLGLTLISVEKAPAAQDEKAALQAEPVPASGPTVKGKPLSGLGYPNKMWRLYLTALEEVMGTNGMNALLRMASCDFMIGRMPPDNLEKAFDFTYIAGLNDALETMYGPRGGRGLEQRIGRAMFSGGLRYFGALAGASDLAFKVLPLSMKLRIGVPAIARVFNVTTDQISNVIEYEDHFIYTLERCSMCWQRETDRPVCHIAVGIIQEALKWLSGGREFKVEMISCMGSGAEKGQIRINKEPLSE
jgi:hypothetical protein